MSLSAMIFEGEVGQEGMLRGREGYVVDFNMREELARSSSVGVDRTSPFKPARRYSYPEEEGEEMRSEKRTCVFLILALSRC